MSGVCWAQRSVYRQDSNKLNQGITSSMSRKKRSIRDFGRLSLPRQTCKAGQKMNKATSVKAQEYACYSCTEYSRLAEGEPLKSLIPHGWTAEGEVWLTIDDYGRDVSGRCSGLEGKGYTDKENHTVILSKVSIMSIQQLRLRSLSMNPMYYFHTESQSIVCVRMSCI